MPDRKRSGVPLTTLYYCDHGRRSKEEKAQDQQYLTPSEEKAVTREPRARDSGAKGPREYRWGVPSIGSIGGDQGSFGGNPRAKGNTGIKGLLGKLKKGVQRVYIYRALSELSMGKLESLRSQAVLNPFTAPCTTALLPCYLHLSYCNPSCCPLATSSYYTNPLIHLTSSNMRQDDKDRDTWMPIHLKIICSLIDELLPDLDFEVVRRCLKMRMLWRRSAVGEMR